MHDVVKYKKLLYNPFILFAPFLILYIALAIVFPTHGNTGDENRYLWYAEYMISGFRSAPPYADYDYLGNGPGYSLVLIPIIALHFPIICITILNALFYYFSIILLFKTVLIFTSYYRALIIGLFWACFYNLYELMILITPEPFCVFLICLLIFCLSSAFSNEKSKKYIMFSGAIFGFIALTKPIFGYVLLFMFIGIMFLWAINRKVINYQKTILILSMAFITTVPYLFYTYHLTGKIFYWSTFGGNNLYWMSTPFRNEYGDWFRDPGPNEYQSRGNKLISGYGDSLRANHMSDFNEINKHKGVEKDEIFKKYAINNIKSYPTKYLQNCITNLGRIFFNYPYSYTIQNPKTLMRLPLNGIILLLMFFCIIPTLINWKRIDFFIRFLLFFALIYLGGCVFASAETRMFTLIAPVFLLWIGFVVEKSIKLNIKKWSD